MNPRGGVSPGQVHVPEDNGLGAQVELVPLGFDLHGLSDALLQAGAIPRVARAGWRGGPMNAPAPGTAGAGPRR